MKNTCVIILSLIIAVLLDASRASAQGIENTSSIEVRYGRTLSAGSCAALCYHHTTSTVFDVSLGGFIQSLQRSGLNYTSYGIDLTGEYATPVGDNTEHRFELKTDFGATAMIDNEPFLYKDLPFAKRLNYGIITGATGEWCISQDVALTIFLQQKILFNKQLGSSLFTTGIGIRLNLD